MLRLLLFLVFTMHGWASQGRLDGLVIGAQFLEY